MTFDEAEKLATQKRSVIGQDFIIPKLGVYGIAIDVVVAPTGNGANVLKEMRENDIDNKSALISLGLINDVQTVIVIGDDKKMLYPLPLEDFLNPKL